MVTHEQYEELYSAAKEIRLHQEFDWEYNTGGNGYNAFEAEGGIVAAFYALGLEKPNIELSRQDCEAFLERRGCDVEDYDLSHYDE